MVKKTIFWSIGLFIILGTVNYLRVNNNWLEETLTWVIPATVGYFCGQMSD